MRSIPNIEFNEKHLECSINSPLAIMRIKEDTFNNLVSLEENNKLYEWFDNVNKIEEVKTILIIADEVAFSEKNYQKFLFERAERKSDSNYLLVNGSTIETAQRAIEINALYNFARQFIKTNKLIITCLAGEVVTPFFGLSLFADLRFGSELMVFSLSHRKFGMHPNGLLPFILTKHLGLSKSMQCLISKDSIDSAEALKMGLLTKVFSNVNFEKQCIEEAKKISLVPQNVIHTTKELLYNFDKEMQDYINKESRFMYR